MKVSINKKELHKLSKCRKSNFYKEKFVKKYLIVGYYVIEMKNHIFYLLRHQLKLTSNNSLSMLRTFSDLGEGKFRLFISKIYLKFRKETTELINICTEKLLVI